MEFLFSVFGIVSVVFIFLILLFIARYKRCPSNKILVVYGKVGGSESAKCIHGGGAFILPIIQEYEFLDLKPIPIDIDLKGALSKQNIRINTPSTFTVGISTAEGIMLNAAERLLGLSQDEIETQATDIIIGQLRLVIATLSIEEINKDREQFLQLINKHVASELNKVGLELINVNIKDITDESGYIEAIGKKAAAEAINKAKVEVADQDASGATGEARAMREKDVNVAKELAQNEEGVKEAEARKRVAIANFETEASLGEAKAGREREVQIALENARATEGRKEADTEQRIKVATLEAEAISGENHSKAKEALSNAELAERMAEAQQRSEVARAHAMKEILEAEKISEQIRLEKEEVVRNEIEKKKTTIDAEAKAQQLINIARGEADSTLLKYQAEAKGMQELLNAKANGYKEIIEACGGDSKAASTLLLLEQLDTLVSRQTEALANLKIDKITVWDSGSNGNANGQNATSSFIRNYISALPPIHDLAKQVGIDLPDYLGSMNVDGEIELPEAEEIKETNDPETKTSRTPPRKRAIPKKALK
ncbi:SPFH domain-containing protein [Reichenbachiella sp. MALMAid0571]|uniref:flotillin family protein n=1 Tax=Reichenbachiella sp. MALMAid0571 TaxID=3143939 RepID=UPI0032DE71CD